MSQILIHRLSCFRYYSFSTALLQLNNRSQFLVYESSNADRFTFADCHIN